MLSSEDVIAAVVLSAFALVLVALYRWFRPRAVDRSCALLAATAVALGLLMAIPGLLHTVAVVGTAVKQHKPYDLRLAWLITIGLILMHSGAVNVVMSRWIQRGERWALSVSAAATALLVLFFVALNPARPQEITIALNGAYLVLLLRGLRQALHRPEAAAL